jgi:hypothetical protein
MVSHEPAHASSESGLTAWIGSWNWCRRRNVRDLGTHNLWHRWALREPGPERKHGPHIEPFATRMICGYRSVILGDLLVVLLEKRRIRPGARKSFLHEPKFFSLPVQGPVDEPACVNEADCRGRKDSQNRDRDHQMTQRDSYAASTHTLPRLKIPRQKLPDKARRSMPL